MLAEHQIKFRILNGRLSSPQFFHSPLRVRELQKKKKEKKKLLTAEDKIAQ